MVKVSVIVPVYNIESYIEQCIQSVLSQTMENFELILINDGSTDNSGDICARYAQCDDRIRYITTENCGAGAARNKGIESAKGEWICFVDGDDYIPQDSLEQLLSAKISPLPDVIIGNYSEDVDGCIIRKEWQNTVSIEHEPMKWLVRAYLYSNMGVVPACAWAKLYRRTFLEAYAFRFSSLKFGEDSTFNIEVFQKATRITCIDESVYVYRMRKNSITHSYQLNVEEDAFHLSIFQDALLQSNADMELRQMYAVKRLRVLIQNVKMSYGHPVCDQTKKKRLQGIDKLCEIYRITEIYEVVERRFLSLKERFLLKLLYKKHYLTALFCYKVYWKKEQLKRYL